jgi:hypothetical protein
MTTAMVMTARPLTAVEMEILVKRGTTVAVVLHPLTTTGMELLTGVKTTMEAVTVIRRLETEM